MMRNDTSASPTIGLGTLLSGALIVAVVAMVADATHKSDAAPITAPTRFAPSAPDDDETYILEMGFGPIEDHGHEYPRLLDADFWVNGKGYPVSLGAFRRAGTWKYWSMTDDALTMVSAKVELRVSDMGSPVVCNIWVRGQLQDHQEGVRHVTCHYPKN